MTTLILASFGTTIVTILLVGVSLLLIGLVLLQKNRGSGLSGAFGGVGGHTAFGTKTGDFLTWVTVAFTALFLLLSVAGVFVFEPQKSVAPPPPAVQPAGSDASPIDITDLSMPADAADGSRPAPVELIPMSSPPEGWAEPAQPSEQQPTEPQPAPTPQQNP